MGMEKNESAIKLMEARVDEIDAEKKEARARRDTAQRNLQAEDSLIRKLDEERGHVMSALHALQGKTVKL